MLNHFKIPVNSHHSNGYLPCKLDQLTACDDAFRTLTSALIAELFVVALIIYKIKQLVLVTVFNFVYVAFATGNFDAARCLRFPFLHFRAVRLKYFNVAFTSIGANFCTVLKAVQVGIQVKANVMVQVIVQ